MAKEPQFKLKNHVGKKGKRLSALLKGKFGFDLATLDKALQGDPQSLKFIGEGARQSKQVLELMPLLKEACLTIEKATEEYNKGVADILKQAGSSAIAIDKASMQTMLASQKYQNQRKETAAEFVSARDSERQRHQYAVGYIQLKSYIDHYLARVDGDNKLIDQSNRPEVKQMSEDSRYGLAAAKHLLEHGQNARLDLLSRKDYVLTQEDTPEGKRVVPIKEKLTQAFGNMFSALGF